MTYITGAVPTVKENRTELFFDKSAFLLATSFSDPYFANDLNWGKIVLFYRDLSSGTQRQVIVLKDSNSRGWFVPSVSSRTGAWQIEVIEVFDKQGDSVRVERASMPSPESFDINVQRIIAPASTASVSNIQGVPVNEGTRGDASNRVRRNAAGTEWWSWDGIEVAVTGLVTSVTVGDVTYTRGGEFSEDGTYSYHYITKVSTAYVSEELTLEAGESAFWEVGFKCKIWNHTDNLYLTNDVYEILDITGNILTLDQQILGGYEGKILKLRFPSFTESSARQKSKYEYVGSPGY